MFPFKFFEWCIIFTTEYYQSYILVLLIQEYQGINNSTLSAYLINKVSNINLACITETWLGPEVRVALSDMCLLGFMYGISKGTRAGEEVC